MKRAAVALPVLIAISVFAAFLILTNAYPFEGPWLPIAPGHGVHLGDIVIVLIWATIVSAAVRWIANGPR